jgi:hypothetical protein
MEDKKPKKPRYPGRVLVQVYVPPATAGRFRAAAELAGFKANEAAELAFEAFADRIGIPKKPHAK